MEISHCPYIGVYQFPIIPTKQVASFLGLHSRAAEASNLLGCETMPHPVE
jgi:hypothetical protein